jgi:hypothetical protein
MYKFFFISILATTIVLSCTKKIQPTQTNTSDDIPEVIVKPIPIKINQKDSFPFSWFGLWEGTLNIYNAKGLTQSLPMQLNYQATDTAGVYKWHIIYGDDKEKGLRPYYLRTVDAQKGVYLHDEMNTIKMESYYIGNRLYCNFNVQGSLLTTIEEKKGDELHWEIIFGKEKPVSITGDQVFNGDTIPAVKTMPIIVSQRAILKRKNKEK